MSELKISSKGWMVISLRNGASGVFNLNDTRDWQLLDKNQREIEDDYGDDELHRNLIKFSPNGEILVINGKNKQLYIYIKSDFEKTELCWELQRIINVKKQTSALDLTNEFLLVGDKNGDVYKIDLSINDKNKNLILSAENCIMRHSSMLLHINFICTRDKKSFILTADRDEKIRLSHYTNTPNIERYCLGHTEFVSYIKLVDNNQILSASGDGTLRLWRFPDCIPLVLLHSKAFTLSSKQVFYSQMYNSESYIFSENERSYAIPYESSLDSSSIDYSIWKMDVASCNSINSRIFIAFSIFAHRSHSIYLTSLSNIEQLANEQRKLILDSSYGTIVDYCFSSKEILIDDYIRDSVCYLYILFDSNTLLKIDIISILLCNDPELFVQSDETIQEINNILASKEFHLIDSMNNDRISNDMIFKQLFKNRTNSDENSCPKRKIEKIETQQRKRQATSQSEKNISLIENF